MQQQQQHHVPHHVPLQATCAVCSFTSVHMCMRCSLLQMSAAAAYFGLDDYQKDTYLGGYLMAAFFLIGAPAALLVSPTAAAAALVARLLSGTSNTRAVH